MIKLDDIINHFIQELQINIPEFQELKEAQVALDTDPISKQLWAEKEEIRETVELLKAQGLPVSQAQEKKLGEMIHKMRENPITMRYLKAKNFARKVAATTGSQLESKVGVHFGPAKPCN